METKFQFGWDMYELQSESEPVVNVYHLKKGFKAEIDFKNGTIFVLHADKKWYLEEKLGKIGIPEITYHSSNGSEYQKVLVKTESEWSFKDFDYKYVKKKVTK